MAPLHAHAKDFATEMTAAPPLPPLDDAAPQWSPELVNPTPAAVPPRPEERRPEPGADPSPARGVLAQVAEQHRHVLATLAESQKEYLGLMTAIGQRLNGAVAAEQAPQVDDVPEGDDALRAAYAIDGDEIFVDLQHAPWLDDHRPDYGSAVLPMTCVAEILAASAQNVAPGLKVVGLRDVSLRRWIVVDAAPLRIRRKCQTNADGSVHVTLLIWRQAARAEMSRDEPVASGDVILAADYPPPPALPAPLSAVRPSPDPYESAVLFHGPAFQLVRDLWSGAEGAGAVLDAGATSAPIGVIHPVLFDTLLQSAADGRWSDWCPEAILETGKGLPLKLASVTFHGSTPREGPVRAEMRAAGLQGGPRFPVLDYWAVVEGRVWASARLVAVGTPAGPMDAFSAPARRAYLRDRTYLPEVHYATFDGDDTILADDTVALANWIPGTLETVFQIAPGSDLVRLVAQKEHAARHFGVHPARITIEGDTARTDGAPAALLHMNVTREDGRVRVRTA